MSKLKPFGLKLKSKERTYSKSEPSIVPEEQPTNKEKKTIPPTKKVVYISKRGSKAIFDSVHLCAQIFGVDESTIRYKINNPVPKKKNTSKGGDWLKGGRLEYVN